MLMTAQRSSRQKPERHESKSKNTKKLPPLNAAELIKVDDVITRFLIDPDLPDERVCHKFEKGELRFAPRLLGGIADGVIRLKEKLRSGGSLLHAADEFMRITKIASKFRMATSSQIKAHVIRYLRLFQPSIGFKLAVTTRYRTLPQTGGVADLTAIATKEWRQGDTIPLIGALAPVSEDQAKEFISEHCSSIMQDGKKNNHILLGPARFVNHDCHPNASLMYREVAGESSAKTQAVLVTRTIAKGMEILVRYSKDYFVGEDGKKTCKCDTCGRHIELPFVKVPSQALSYNLQNRENNSRELRLATEPSELINETDRGKDDCCAMTAELSKRELRTSTVEQTRKRKRDSLTDITLSKANEDHPTYVTGRDHKKRQRTAQ
ncbi:hypothetical protein BT69DRAFT_1341122 [Atractiella rhizophila]|nr:hypothetical protein BT69DRAFT_1341122 [Atractiella rhizophila]